MLNYREEKWVKIGQGVFSSRLLQLHLDKLQAFCKTQMFYKQMQLQAQGETNLWIQNGLSTPLYELQLTFLWDSSLAVNSDDTFHFSEVYAI